MNNKLARLSISTIFGLTGVYNFNKQVFNEENKNIS